MTAMQDQIMQDLRDYITDGEPSSGPYTPQIADVRDILYEMAVGGQFITEIETLLNASTVAAARTALALGSSDSPTFAALTVSGNLTVDTNTLKVDATNNRVGVGTASPSVGFEVAVAALLTSTLAVSGAVTLSADLTVDTSTFKVDSSNNRVGIGTASPGHLLDVSGGESRFTANNATFAMRIIQTGVGNSLLIEDTSSTDTTPWLVDGSGNMVSGHTSAQTFAGSVTPTWQFHGTGSGAGLGAARWSADAVGPVLVIEKSRGTGPGSRGAVSTNDSLGVIAWAGDDGSAGRRAAELSVEVDASPGSSDMPGRLVLKLSPDGSATPAEVFRIDRTGFMSFGGDTDTGFFRPGSNELAIYSGGGEAVRFDESGIAVFGYTDARTAWSGTPRLQVVGANNSAAAAGIWRMSDDANPGLFNLNKARGSAGSQSAATSGDGLGTITFSGYDGSAYTRGAYIAVEADDTVSSGVVPGRIRFYVATTGGTLTERFRLASGGNAYFPGHGTTASGANAFINSASSPVGELLRSTSSIRYKTAVTDLPEADIGILDALRPITYRSKAPSDDPFRVHLGFIAEEAAEIDPRLVHYTNLEGQMVPDGFQYERLTVLLVAGYQKLAARVAALENA
jgi:hypothetical protein